MFSKTAIVALFAGLVAGQATPKGDPSGNPITRPLNEVVPACKPFTITWQPTTPNSVSLLLLKGPSTNVVQFGPPIVVAIPNSGSFVWTPPSSLEATSGPTGYGIQLIDDVTGQYQYSTQFGISKGAECNSYVTPSPSSSQYGGGYPASTPLSSSSSKAAPSSSMVVPTLTPGNTKITASMYPTGTGFVSANSSIILPTKSMSVPSSLLTTATGSATKSAPPQVTTNAAAGLQAGLGMVGAAAAFAFML